MAQVKFIPGHAYDVHMAAECFGGWIGGTTLPKDTSSIKWFFWQGAYQGADLFGAEPTLDLSLVAKYLKPLPGDQPPLL